MKRKLTTIFCADVSGYSRLMGADEARTLATLKEYREAIEGFIARHHGRVVSWSGDGLLAEFASVVEAVQCAVEVQQELKARNADLDEDRRMTFRIGINLGDVMVDGEDIFGEGVNIGARLQQMAPPGGILISSPVYDQVRGKLTMQFAPLGAQTVKNIAGEVAVYAVTVDGVTPQPEVLPARPSRGHDGEAAGATSAESGPAIRTTRAKMVRRGMALFVDYVIVAGACLAAALVINTTVSATAIKMDLDIPLFDYGDVIDRTPWVLVDTERERNAEIHRENRLVTYDYWGLFTQTYLQERTRAGVTIRDKERRPSAAPAPAPAPEPAPAPDAAAPPSPSEPPASPTPPAPPTPPDVVPPTPPTPPGGVGAIPAIPNVTVEGGVVSLDGQVIVDTNKVNEQVKDMIAQAMERQAEAMESARAAAEDRRETDEHQSDRPGLMVGMRDEEGGGFRLFGSYVSESLVDPLTAKPITRPSLDTLSLLLLALYLAVMEMGRRGSTIGKSAFNLIVTRENGGPLNFGTALGRNIIKVLTLFIFPIAILVALLSKRRQGIHDRIVGTVVVRELEGFAEPERERPRDRRRRLRHA